LTDFDGANLLSVSRNETQATMFMQWGFDDLVQHKFMFLAQRVSEFEEQMAMRSRALVDEIRCEVLNNTAIGNSSFAVRKNGDDVNAQNPLFNLVQFDYAAAENGVKTSDKVLEYAKGDYICWQFFEAEPLYNVDVRLSLRIRFLKE